MRIGMEMTPGMRPALDSRPLKYDNRVSRWLDRQPFVAWLQRAGERVNTHWWAADIIVAWAIGLPGLLIALAPESWFDRGLTYVLVHPNWWAGDLIGGALVLLCLVLHIPRQTEGTRLEDHPWFGHDGWPLVHDQLAIAGATAVGYIAASGVWGSLYNHLTPVSSVGLLGVSAACIAFTALRFFRKPDRG